MVGRLTSMTRHASSRVMAADDASAPVFAQVMTHMTHTSDITENKGMTRMTRSPMFDAPRGRAITVNTRSASYASCVMDGASR